MRSLGEKEWTADWLDVEGQVNGERLIAGGAQELREKENINKRLGDRFSV